jgi:hypothetical protein
MHRRNLGRFRPPLGPLTGLEGEQTIGRLAGVGGGTEDGAAVAAQYVE